MTASLTLTAPVRESSYRISEILSALSCALDITEGQAPGHAVRTCLIGMRLAERVGLQPEERGSLFYALLLKDLGCASVIGRPITPTPTKPTTGFLSVSIVVFMIWDRLLRALTKL